MSAALPAAFDPWFQALCPDIPLPGARAVLDLAAEGATVAFIARYRRERTGNLDEEAVRRTLAAREKWQRVCSRQAIILESIERHATLAPELRARILATFDADVLEDLYLPYGQKKKSRAAAAREAGLEPLADWVWSCGHGTETPQEGQTLELWAFTFRDPDKRVPDAKTAIEGARDILVERLSEDADLRTRARRAYFDEGWLRATPTPNAKPNGKFEAYFSFQEKVSVLRETAHASRYLALRRGLSEGELLLSVGGPVDDPEFESRLIAAFEATAVSVPDSPGAEVLRQAARIAFKGYVRNAMENEVHRGLKAAADAAAARVLADNLRRVLLEAPFGAKPVLGVVSGGRSGGKMAVVDSAGALILTAPFFLEDEAQRRELGETLGRVAREHGVQAVAVGNGSGGREAELFVRKTLREAGADLTVVLLSEAPASAHGGSEAGRTEFPELEPTARAAISIARRLQDPLAELVKIEPRTLALGQYQHDVTQSVLQQHLDRAVESCVNAVGVNVNAASRWLLARVSGLGPATADDIVAHRDKQGPFRSRRQLLEVPHLEEKGFEQAAGFLRVPGGESPLDNTPVHPERYPVLEALARRHDKTVADLLGAGVALVREAKELEQELGPWTFEDVVRALETPGGDPRGPFTPFSFREDVRELADLKPGMTCPGIVSNVTGFGAFVDIGAPHEGLIHVSQLGRKFVREPREVIGPGDRVEVRVLKVDQEKRQISLSLRPPPPGRRPTMARSRGRPGVATPPPRAGDRRPPRKAGRSGPGRERPAARPSKPSERPPGQPGGGRPPAFNNPFAVLASLKVQKRGKS